MSKGHGSGLLRIGAHAPVNDTEGNPMVSLREPPFLRLPCGRSIFPAAWNAVAENRGLTPGYSVGVCPRFSTLPGHAPCTRTLAACTDRKERPMWNNDRDRPDDPRTRERETQRLAT